MDNSKNFFYVKETNLIEMQLKYSVVYILYLRVLRRINCMIILCFIDVFILK